MIALKGFDRMPQGDSEAKYDLKGHTEEELARFLEERFGMAMSELIEKGERDPAFETEVENVVSEEFGPLDSGETA